MTEPPTAKPYRFLSTFFVAVIALSSVLVVIELSQVVSELKRPRVVSVICDKYSDNGDGIRFVYVYYSDGTFSHNAQTMSTCFPPPIKQK